MSNKVVGLLLTVPPLISIAGLIIYFIDDTLVSGVDEQLYIALALIFMLGFFAALIKLWKLPTPEKKLLPLSNRQILFSTIIAGIFASLTENADLGNQLEMLIGLICCVLILSIITRIISAEINNTENSISLKQVLIRIIGVTTASVLLIGFLVYSDYSPKETTSSTAPTATSTDYSTLSANLTELEKISVTKELLAIYYELWFVTQDNSEEALTESEVISTWMREVMNDKNRIIKLKYRIEPLVSSKNQTISVTALSIQASLISLEKSFTDFENYLRTVNEYNFDMAEFRYQGNLHMTSNKDAFLTMLEGTALYPYLFIEFGKNGESNKFSLSEDGKKEILAEIDRLFADAFVEHEKWNAETGFHNSVIIIVEQLQKFLETPIEQAP
jgi:hypothetical protein